ncbi:hypothetical protein B0H17DRAFT_1107204 [Mycena rosella]|uniref:Uncharacterized protein n=1 Tax=Mycena rosella TaxID=1033263 RepID=A0AAD7C2P3_MYCRO|nr:hypothetical protein B0H17DRAFT_1107204 [Mycena rosella]
MSFAKPPSKAPTRGRSVPSSAARGRPNPTTRTPSISSTSSSRSSHSKASVKEDASVKGFSSRPSSVCSNHSEAAATTWTITSAPAREPPQGQPIDPEPSGSNSNANANPAPQPTSDPLQVAAQVYPWMYMTSTLDACFKSAETAAEKDLAARTAELALEAADLSEQRARLEAERRVEFYDELSSDKFATAAPSIMQAFLLHGDACTLVEAEALQLATSTAPAEDDYYSPMRPYNALLDRLEELQRERAQLHASIVALTQEDASEEGMESDVEPDQPSARAQIIHVFGACLPVLQARAANLQMAHELLEGAKENLAMSLHLESLEFSGDEDE